MLYLTKSQSKFAENIVNRLTNSPDVIKCLEDKIYSANNVLLSYRQINEMSKSGIFIDKRNINKRGWRKFSFKEAMYLNIIKKFKEAGLTNNQLRGFKNSYYTNGEFDKALYLALTKQNIIVSIDEKDNADYSDWLRYTISRDNVISRGFKVSINFYRVIKEFLEINPQSAIDTRVFCNFYDTIRRELGDYPEEVGMTEEEIKKLIDKLFSLSGIIYEKWIDDVSKG